MNKTKHIRGVVEMIDTAREVGVQAINAPMWLSAAVFPRGEEDAKIMGVQFSAQVVQLLTEYANSLEDSTV